MAVAGPGRGKEDRMSATHDTLESLLIEDVQTLGDGLADEQLCRDLYRALAARALSRRGTAGHIALSWERAEDVVNLGRSSRALPQLEGLAGSGGEGEVSARARKALEAIGWTSKPESTQRHDDRHVDSPEDPPPASRPGGEPPEWERRAHAEAERNRLR
jgi:hypothetical protein